jgi:hypothetical protein
VQNGLPGEVIEFYVLLHWVKYDALSFHSYDRPHALDFSVYLCYAFVYSLSFCSVFLFVNFDIIVFI